MIHGIRILSKQGCTLIFKTYLIYSDWNRLPKTHGFPLLFLSDYTGYWEPGETPFEKDLRNQKADLYEDAGHAELCQRYVKKLTLSDIENIPVKPEFLEYTWHYLDGNPNFHFEEHLPQATYELEVSDEKWIQHIPVGALWETTACDFLGPYWHLETPGEDGKFYKIFRSIDGPWILNYGKKGKKGRREKARYMDASIAADKVKEKIKKGYKLVYKNIDSDWNIEDELVEKAVKETKKASVDFNAPAFFKALEKGKFRDVEKCLEEVGDPNMLRDEWGNYALEVASGSYYINEERYKVTKALLEKGADPNLGNYGPFFPGHCYSNWDNPWQEKTIQLFLDSGVDISRIGGMDEHSLLQSAAVSGRIDLLKTCIDAGLDPMHRSAQGHTAMHYAASNLRNTKAIIDLLLDKGADVNDNNGSWGTPLHFSASALATAYLIEKGADIHARDSNGKQAIHLAADLGKPARFEILLEAGADAESKTNEGLTPTTLILARVLGSSAEINKACFSKLEALSKHIKIDWKDSKLVDALLSTSKSKKKITKTEESSLIALINLGFDPFLQSEKSFNLFLFSAKTQNLALLQACLACKNPDVNLQDEYGWTAMHYAKATQNQSLINMMFDSGASFDQTLASRKQRKFGKVKYPRGTTAESMD